MIGVDTNILVYAHREDSRWHPSADKCITELAESGNPWAIAWSCLHEFLAIVTHPRIYDPPSALKDALLQIEYWLECPTLELPGELSDYWSFFKKTVLRGKIRGPAVHDARIASIYLQHNIKTIWSADRDFSHFHGLNIVNPLLLEEI